MYCIVCIFYLHTESHISFESATTREGVRNFVLGWQILVKIFKMRNYKILPFVRKIFGMAAATFVRKNFGMAAATPLTNSLYFFKT